MERGTAGLLGSGDEEVKGGQTQDTEIRSNRSSATFRMDSRPNSLEIALREAFKSSNCESDLSMKFLSDVDRFGGNLVIEETFEHSELPEDWPQP